MTNDQRDCTETAAERAKSSSLVISFVIGHWSLVIRSLAGLVARRTSISLSDLIQRLKFLVAEIEFFQLRVGRDEVAEIDVDRPAGLSGKFRDCTIDVVIGRERFLV